MSYFNKFQMAQDTYDYAWLSFDNYANKKLYDYCSQSLKSWNISYVKF